MEIYCVPAGILRANCYIVCDGDKNAAIIDPGGSADTLKKRIESIDAKPLKILLTHGHFDHIGAADVLGRFYGIKTYIHEADNDMLLHPGKYWESMDSLVTPVCCKDEWLYDGDKVSVGALEFDVLHTPGHSEGSVTYRCEDVLFTGDTLFEGSIGRTDLPGGDMTKMVASLKKLSALNGDYKVFCGHGNDTVLGYERQNNIFMR